MHAKLIISLRDEVTCIEQNMDFIDKPCIDELHPKIYIWVTMSCEKNMFNWSDGVHNQFKEAGTKKEKWIKIHDSFASHSPT